MSMGPLGGIPASVAGSPLAQTAGSEVERAKQETAAQQRRVDANQKAENAAGIGEADGEDHETAERDADGRRLWEGPPQPPTGEEPEPGRPGPQERRSRDATGQSGNLLDLTG